MTVDDIVRLEIIGSVAVVSFNRPHVHNAVDDATALRLNDRLDEIEGMQEVRAVVLRGEGSSFSSGRDTRALGQRPGGETDLEFVGAAQQRIRRLSSCRVPVVAALKGWVLGGSFERALHCDLRVASPDARMALPEVGFGLIPDTGGVARLVQLAGPGLALDMVLTGRVLTGEEALVAGVVSRLSDDPDGAALEIATAVAEKPTLAVHLARRIIHDVGAAASEQAMQTELLSQVECFASPEYQALRAERLARRA